MESVTTWSPSFPFFFSLIFCTAFPKGHLQSPLTGTSGRERSLLRVASSAVASAWASLAFCLGWLPQGRNTTFICPVTLATHQSRMHVEGQGMFINTPLFDMTCKQVLACFWRRLIGMLQGEFPLDQYLSLILSGSMHALYVSAVSS